MNRRLQDAVKKVTAPPELAERIRAAVLAAGPPRKPSRWPFYALGLAAALLALVAVAVEYQQGHFRFTEGSRQSYIEAIAARIDHVMSLGLCDHVQCAVFREYPHDPPSWEELEHTLGPANQDLLSATAEHVPSGYRLVMAHRCAYKGRPFTHLTFRNGKSVLSLLITKRGEDEWVSDSLAQWAVKPAGLTFYEASVQKYQVAAFETPGHLVYVVSDLSPNKNLEVLADLAPSVSAVLRKSES